MYSREWTLVCGGRERNNKHTHTKKYYPRNEIKKIGQKKKMRIMRLHVFFFILLRVA
jgi:hypothetical protein